MAARARPAPSRRCAARRAAPWSGKRSPASGRGSRKSARRACGRWPGAPGGGGPCLEAPGWDVPGSDGAHGGDEKQEAPGQVALARLVVAAGFGIADATVVLAEHGLAAAEDADRPAPRVVHRNGGMAHAVARLAIGRILRPEALVVRAPGRQLVRHDALPVVCREHDGEAVQPPALAAVLAVGIEDLLHDLGIREVLRPHG